MKQKVATRIYCRCFNSNKAKSVEILQYASKQAMYKYIIRIGKYFEDMQNQEVDI